MTENHEEVRKWHFQDLKSQETKWEVKIRKILFYRADNSSDKLHGQAGSCDFAV